MCPHDTSLTNKIHSNHKLKTNHLPLTNCNQLLNAKQGSNSTTETTYRKVLTLSIEWNLHSNTATVKSHGMIDPLLSDNLHRVLRHLSPINYSLRTNEPNQEPRLALERAWSGASNGGFISLNVVIDSARNDDISAHKLVLGVGTISHCSSGGPPAEIVTDDASS